MSNFSQYFPVSGGSGAGSGIPINGYFPFLLNTSTTGYDSATGLYTHPDGTFWVETGNTVYDTNGTYPSATGTALAKWSYSNFSFSFSSTLNRAEGMYFDGTTFYIYDGNTSRVYTFNSSGVYSGFNFSTSALEGGTVWESMQFNPATGNLVANNRTTAVEFSLTGVATGFSFASTFSGLAIDPSGNYYGMPYGGFFGDVVQYDATGTATGFSFSMSPYFTAPADVIFHDGTSIYIKDGNTTTIHEWTAAGVYVGVYTISSPSGGGLYAKAGSLYDGNYYFATRGNPHTVNSYAAFSGIQIGDLTARTDTDTAQPLFVRIG